MKIGLLYNNKMRMRVSLGLKVILEGVLNNGRNLTYYFFTVHIPNITFRFFKFFPFW